VERIKIEIEGLETDVGSAAELAAVFDVLSGQYDRLVIEKLDTDLPGIIANGKGFYQVLKSLSPENSLYILETLGEKTGLLFSNARELAEVLAFLSLAETEKKLLELIGTQRLREIIKCPEELAEILEWVYEDTDKSVIGLLGGEYLANFFRSGTELSLVLNCLDAYGQALLIDLTGWSRLAGLSRSWQDLAFLLRALPSVLSKKYLSEFKPETVKELMANAGDWERIKKFLEPDEEALLKNMAEVDYAE
jgi:hypothetical protein